jgi:aspartate dehydrogenase
MLDICLIGYGAIGQSLHTRLLGHAALRISHVVVRPERVTAVQAQLAAHDAAWRNVHPDGAYSATQPSVAQAVTSVPVGCRLALESAGHSALLEHVLPALARGVECAVLSVGALSEQGLPEKLADAAAAGNTQVHLLSGAIGGIDAIAAAKLAGLDEVVYTGRKPPAAWGLTELDFKNKKRDVNVKSSCVTIILEASARQAAAQFPKNANVAATVALAGLGLDATRVRLLADDGVTENVHEIVASGAFGSMRLEMRGKPLADNPKTSALTVLSALRFLTNRAASITV